MDNNAKPQYGVEKCWCGHCETYWLTGIGSFVQGSGFQKHQAEHIAKLLNENPVPEPWNGSAQI